MGGRVNFLSVRRRTGARSTRSASFLVGARRAVSLLFGDRTRSPTLWRRVLDRVGRLPGSLLQRALNSTPHYHRQPASPSLHRALLRKSSPSPFLICETLFSFLLSTVPPSQSLHAVSELSQTKVCVQWHILRRIGKLNATTVFPKLIEEVTNEIQ